MKHEYEFLELLELIQFIAENKFEPDEITFEEVLDKYNEHLREKQNTMFRKYVNNIDNEKVIMSNGMIGQN